MKQLNQKKTAARILPFFIFSLIVLMGACQSNRQQTIDLSGEWQFRMDPNDRGIDEKWFEDDFSETVNLPGSMVENGKGNDITLETEWIGTIRIPEWQNDPNYAPYVDSANVRFPFWLQPLKKYTGAAWYLKSISIPDDWQGSSVQLNMERPHWESAVWINGKQVGIQNSLATAHVYDVTKFLTPGENKLAVRIDNRIKDVDPGINAHSITDHSQTNWNGIVGEISLNAKGKIYFENVEIFPDVESKTAEIRARVVSSFSEPKTADLSATAMLKSTRETYGSQQQEFTLSPGDNVVIMNYELGEEALLWDEFNPNVYQLEFDLKSGKETDQASIDFGFRDFKVEGTRFSINGRPVFIRGTLECAIFPLTGYPPTDTGYWKKIYTAVKDHGLNHVRFHSWCPPKAAFEAADEMGVYLQVECSSWAHFSTQLGSGFPIDQYVWDESKRIVEDYGNHPSFLMMAYGNEPTGPNNEEFLTEFVNYWKQQDKRRLYTGAAGWPVLEANEFHNKRNPRIQYGGMSIDENILNSQVPNTDFDWAESLNDFTIPVVSHEIGQWCVYPNFREIEKYTGVLKPKNFEIFRESLNDHHMGHLADSFLLASGKLQALCYKAEIEVALRTPGFAGFQLLDLHDFPGQGTALVGVLDPFWEQKGYITPEEYRRFCNTTVPLARLKKRIFTEGETMTAGVEIAHFGEYPFEGVNPFWKIIQNNEIIAEGTLGQCDIPIGNAIPLGEVVYEFQKENTPRKLTLEVGVDDFENSWDIWVYPENNPAETGDIRIVENLNASTLNDLRNGGIVLLSLGKGKVAPEMGGDIGIGFAPFFWNTAWFSRQKTRSLGILCNPEHPALELFPTEYHSNWQWRDAMSHSDAIQLDSFSPELRPIIQIVDDWVTNRRLGLLVEAKVGKGKILISGIDLQSDMENRPEARQLLTSIMNYMSGDKFNPNVSLTSNEIKDIIK